MAANDAIALYSSDATILYKADVFRAMALPSGYTMQFRYEKKYLAPQFHDKYESLKHKTGVIFFIAGNDVTKKISDRVLTRYSIRRCKIIDVFEDGTTKLVILIIELDSFVDCELDESIRHTEQSPLYFVSALSPHKQQARQWYDQVKKIESHFPGVLFFTISELLSEGTVIKPAYDSRRRLSLFKIKEEANYTLKCSCYDREGGSRILEIETNSSDIYYANLFESGIGATRDPRWLPLTTGTLKTLSVPVVLRFYSPTNIIKKAQEDPNLVRLYFFVYRSRCKIYWLGFLSVLTVLGALFTQISSKNITDPPSLVLIGIKLLGVVLFGFCASEFYRFFGKTSLYGEGAQETRRPIGEKIRTHPSISAIFSFYKRYSLGFFPFYKRHPLGFLIASYILVFALITPYYIWQLTRDNPRLFVFVEDPGAYVDVAHAFLQGKVSVVTDPGPRFDSIKNPYDPVQREQMGAPYPWDYSYYRAPDQKAGHFYLYFQPGPVLLFYLPQYFLTGAFPSQRWVVFLASEIDLLFFVLFLRLLVRRYFPNTPLSLEVLLLFMFGLCNLNNLLQAAVGPYQVSICTGLTFAMGCFPFIILALEAVAYRWIWMGLASLCAGFAFGCRPTNFFLFIILGGTWLFIWKKEGFRSRTRFVVETVALALPMLLCYAASAWYNYARFRNILEFGLTYQLNGGEAYMYEQFSFKYVLDSIWCYFLQPWSPIHYFPFVDIDGDDWYPFLYPDRMRMPPSGLLPAFPILFIGLAWPFYIQAQSPLRRNHVGFIGLLLTLWSGIIILVVSMFYAMMHRYAAEMMSPLLLLVSLTLLMRRQASPFRTWEKIILFLLFTYSFYLGIVYGLQGELRWVEFKLHNLYGWPYAL